MKIVTISDTHGKHRLLRNLPEADMIIHAGDVTMQGSEHSTVDFMNWFSKLDYKYKIFIAGNHDFLFEREPAKYIKKLIPDNLIYLNDNGLTIEGFKIWGSPITPRFFDWAFNRDRGKEINKHWKLIPKDTDLLITHGPPQGILDLVGLNEMVGCEDLLKRVRFVKPKVHVFGHIHGAYGVKEVKGTRYINASSVDEEYTVCNNPVLFNL